MTDRQTIDVYEAEAARYAALGLSVSQSDAIKQFLAALAPESHILDLGCGPGVHAEIMVAAGHNVDAIDATPAFVAAAKERGVNARLGTFDDVTGDAIYDGIYASFSLLHAPRVDLPRHLSAIAQALKPGGTLFLGMKTGVGESRDTIGRRYSYVTEEELAALVIAVGLQVTDTITGEEAGLSGEVAPYILMLARA